MEGNIACRMWIIAWRMWIIACPFSHRISYTIIVAWPSYDHFQWTHHGFIGSAPMDYLFKKLMKKISRGNVKWQQMRPWRRSSRTSFGDRAKNAKKHTFLSGDKPGLVAGSYNCTPWNKQPTTLQRGHLKVFQPSSFRGYVSFREGIDLNA